MSARLKRIFAWSRATVGMKGQIPFIGDIRVHFPRWLAAQAMQFFPLPTHTVFWDVRHFAMLRSMGWRHGELRQVPRSSGLYAPELQRDPKFVPFPPHHSALEAADVRHWCDIMEAP